MQHRFSVGELGIMRNASYFSEHNGALAVATGELRSRNPINVNVMRPIPTRAYQVRILSGDEPIVSGKPYLLRKLGSNAPLTILEKDLQAETICRE